MQCINHIGMKRKSSGVLCAVVRKKKVTGKDDDERIVDIGCVCIQDGMATTVALLTNPSCFFKGTSSSDSLSTYFNRMHTFTHQEVFRGGIFIYVLNQLNGIRPFSERPSDFSNVISMYDSAFSCSICGPDIMHFSMCMHQDKLLRNVKRMHHERGSNVTPKTNKSNNSKKVSRSANQ